MQWQELITNDDDNPSSSMTVIDKDGDAFNVGGGGDWEVPSVDCGSASDGAMYIQVGPAAMHRGNQGEHEDHYVVTGDAPDCPNI